MLDTYSNLWNVLVIGICTVKLCIAFLKSKLYGNRLLLGGTYTSLPPKWDKNDFIYNENGDSMVL